MDLVLLLEMLDITLVKKETEWYLPLVSNSRNAYINVNAKFNKICFRKFYSFPSIYKTAEDMSVIKVIQYQDTEGKLKEIDGIVEN